MPRDWHDRHAANKIEDDDKREFYRSIVADKKPYFMRYIYPALMRQYNTYIKDTDRNALREFQMTVSEMLKMPYAHLSERQKEFLRYFDYRMPVGTGDCVMNKICRRFENEFDGYVGRSSSGSTFDYSIMKSDAEYTTHQYYDIKRLYENYNRRLASYTMYSKRERVDEGDIAQDLAILNEEFLKECNIACSNGQTLCNILLDICYSRSNTKRLVWRLCGSEIINNLLKIHNNLISFPAIDSEGSIVYCGERYRVETTRLEESHDDCIE